MRLIVTLAALPATLSKIAFLPDFPAVVAVRLNATEGALTEPQNLNLKVTNLYRVGQKGRP